VIVVTGQTIKSPGPGHCESALSDASVRSRQKGEQHVHR
jgi:hypothetical protein